MRLLRLPAIGWLFLLSAFTFPAHGQKYRLVWHDEFNYRGLPDSTKWNYDTGGHGWGNHELEYYTARRLENARVDHGLLTIEARKEDYQGMHYTSARLVTKGKADWQYGKIEVRAKLPKGRGTWPAIWMLGSTTPLRWPDDGEIDIMEHVGFHPGFIHGSIHCKKYYHSIGTQKTDTIQVPDCSDAFHVYGLEWDKDTVRISVDGKVYFRFGNEHSGYAGWPFDNKMHLLLNVAVGGDWGGQKGVDDSIWPQKMEIDYVRVWQRK
ncbi:MAG TPA: glycoside hydrolase family 16 protein [Chitinophagaceae bacterium]|nr:glycoside hydrolase family 16 protein [Chitinophagaceae bacterium]